jgi:hypothetical protein
MITYLASSNLTKWRRRQCDGGSGSGVGGDRRQPDQGGGRHMRSSPRGRWGVFWAGGRGGRMLSSGLRALGVVHESRVLGKPLLLE